MTIATAFSERGVRVVEGAVLCLAGGPYLLQGETRVELPEGGRRLLALVALHGGVVDRRWAAGTLWPESGEARASGNLRSALWRMRCSGLDLLEAHGSRLGLRDGVAVDVASVQEWVSRMIDGPLRDGDLRVSPDDLQSLDLLPGWYDDWVVFERERLRQRVLHGLETLTRVLVDQHRWGPALDAAMAAVNMEPLRESAQRVLAEVHLAEGNVVEARRVVERYRTLVRAELGIDPSGALLALVAEGPHA